MKSLLQRKKESTFSLGGNQFSSSLVDQVNTALQELLQDGTVEKLFQEYDTVYVSPLS